MVKLTGPGLAQGASGSLADQLTFSNWKGQAYLKTKPNPTQPNTPPQRAMRAMMAWLARAWTPTPPYIPDTWEALAAELNISPFNAYQGYNLERWRSGHYPSIRYPALETGLYTWADTITAQGGPRHVKLSLRITQPRDGWGIFLHHSFACPITPTWDNLAHVVNGLSAQTIHWVHAPLPAGVHCYQWTRSTKFGAPRLYLGACVQANVT